MTKQKVHHSGGYSLIELMIVLFIITVVSSIVIINLKEAYEATKRKADTRFILCPTKSD